MPHAAPLQLVTERLVIRPWRLDEAPRVLDILSRVEVARWLGDGEPHLMADLDEATRKIEEWNLLEEPLGQWAIEVTETGVSAGSVMLVPIPDSGGLVQIGWHLHPDTQGLGYATEAARAVLAHGLSQGISEIRALTHVPNHASRAVAERLGMTDLGVTDQWYDEPSQLFLATSEQGSASRQR